MPDFFRIIFYCSLLLYAVWLCPSMAAQGILRPAIDGKTATGDTLPLSVQVPIQRDTAKTVLSDSLSNAAATRSAKRAALWSLLPGAGQCYNRQYWKSPIATGSVFGLTYMAIKSKRDYNDYDKKQRDMLTQYALGNPNVLDSTLLNQWRADKKVALQQHNLFRTLALVAYGINIADAAISARLLNEKKGHAPLRAAYYAALLPGAGQAYNRKYWKMPIVYAGLGAGAYAIYYNKNEFDKYTNEYLARTHPGYAETNPRLVYYSESSLLKIRSIYKRYYEISLIATSLWYVATVLDAVIDAHLYEFDISDNLSWHISPFVVPLPISHGAASNYHYGSLSWSAGLSWSMAF